MIAPEAKLVLLATNPAETGGVQGFPGMVAAERYAVSEAREPQFRSRSGRPVPIRL